MTAVTSRIGLSSTLAVSNQHPHYVSRLFATLDHLTRGWVGWNVVTFAIRHETSTGSDATFEHDRRYDHADEFLEVCYKLWQSWDEDALLMGCESGIFADATKIHGIHHEGEFFVHGGH